MTLSQSFSWRSTYFNVLTDIRLLYLKSKMRGIKNMRPLSPQVVSNAPIETSPSTRQTSAYPMTTGTNFETSSASRSTIRQPFHIHSSLVQTLTLVTVAGQHSFNSIRASKFAYKSRLAPSLSSGDPSSKVCNNAADDTIVICPIAGQVE